MILSNLHLHLRMVRIIKITLMPNYMKNRVAYFAMTVFFSGLITTLSYAQSALIGNIDEANRLISIHDCAGAEVYARNNFPRPMVHTIFGMIQLDCRHDRKTAVEYLKMAARDNETIAIEMLMRIGENTSEFSRVNPDQSMQSQGDASTLALPLPPPHTFSTLPRPRPRPQPPQLIIIQQAFNPAACIQDGGGTYCPFYRR